MGDVFFVWTATYQTCLMRACVPRLLSGLYRLFDLCLIKHVLTVWPLTSTLACLVPKQCLMVFGRQTFPVCPGLYLYLSIVGPSCPTQTSWEFERPFCRYLLCDVTTRSDSLTFNIQILLTGLNKLLIERVGRLLKIVFSRLGAHSSLGAPLTISVQLKIIKQN